MIVVNQKLKSSRFANILTFKQMTNYLFITFFTFSILFRCFGQCNIKTNIEDNGEIQYLSENMEIFKNPRFNLGIQAGFVKLEVRNHPTNSDLKSFKLMVFTANKGSFPEIVARKIQIIFINGGVLSLDADTSEEPIYSDNIKINTTIFQLGIANFEKLGYNPIKSISLYDQRINQKLENTSIYKEIFIEQVKCLLKVIR